MPPSNENPATGFWAVVELYGHRRFAGRITEAAFPAGFVQIDICDGPSVIYNPRAVFSVAPVTEQAARVAAKKCCDDPAPIKPWESGEQQRIEALRAALAQVLNIKPGAGATPDSIASALYEVAREALAADDTLAKTDEPPASEPLDDDDDPEAW